MRDPHIGAPFYSTLLAASGLTFALHEIAHWSAGEMLGYDMIMSLNGAHPRSGAFSSARHAFIVDAAGPAFTAFQALVAFLLIERRALLLAYPFLFVACFMRFAALFASLFHPNDEARMSATLGWNMWVLPILMVAILLALTWAGSRRLRVGWKTNLASYLLCSAAFALIVFMDAQLAQR